MRKPDFIVALSVIVMGLSCAQLTWAIPQSDMPSFQYDANEFYADKDLKKVAEATRLAVANNWQMRITAPAEWHDKLMAVVKQTAAGKPVTVDFTNTIIESVVINLSRAKKPLTRKKQRPKPRKSKPAALTAPKVSRLKAEKPSRDGVFAETTSPMTLDEIKPAMPKQQKSPGSATQTTPAGTAIASDTGSVPPAEKADQAPPTSEQALAKPVVVSPAVENEAGSTKGSEAKSPEAAGEAPPREWLQNNYLHGKAVTRQLSIEKIRNDDQIMVRDGEYLLVRFSHGRRDGWWLKSPVDLTSVGLKKIGKDKYRVENKIRLVKDTRKMLKAKPETNAVNSPAAAVNLEEERLRLQKLYNKGRQIKKTLLPKNIHKDDIIIVGNGLKLLIRSERDGSLRRYWLEGDVNLENTDVFHQDSARKFTALRKYTPDDAQ